MPRLTSERAAGPIILVILAGSVFSIALAILTFSDKLEKKLIPGMALFLTVVNWCVILFFYGLAQTLLRLL
ncbi:hypothetical protein [Jeotgalibacillus proteolyticus]|uniref:Uncharacterized protein n=1 Tax=Jeotgalibacillus proteolyticus TaxID=2082395 RepID=A0A2S5GDF3_9BACL|nr:hypothetical protein [Jeotgalibacillus proteolyticus]PPA71067.1 hypothetical protein C4B60_09840 [Jeotgalibacillus proteolyticus]